MKEGDAQLLVIHFDTFYSLPPPHTCPYRDYNCPYLYVLPFHIDSICHWEHYPPLPRAGPATRPTIITYSIRGLRYELRVFFLQKSRLPPTSDLCTCLPRPCLPGMKGKKKEKTKSIKNHKIFSEFYSLADFAWFRVADLFSLFIYLFIYLYTTWYLVLREVLYIV